MALRLYIFFDFRTFLKRGGGGGAREVTYAVVLAFVLEVLEVLEVWEVRCLCKRLLHTYRPAASADYTFYRFYSEV